MLMNPIPAEIDSIGYILLHTVYAYLHSAWRAKLQKLTVGKMPKKTHYVSPGQIV